jgi:nitrite reductase/ring-hydroxylating ferredoxin subunit
MESRKMKRRIVRVPGASRLEDGHARKVVVPVDGDGPALEIVLVRRAGILYALDSLCPHEGGRLAEGPLWEGRYVYCPLHLYRFDPRTGASIEVECDRARTYPVREVDGAAEIEIPGERG